MNPKDDLTFEFVYKILTYDCFDGELRWSDNLSDLDHMRPSSAVRLRGKTAGSLSSKGYIQIRIKGKKYMAHRLAWLMTLEKYPDGEIDHIDGNRSNNRIENFRDATNFDNARNRRISKNSMTGVNGVSFRKNKKRYTAYISSNGKRLFIGHFNTIEEAAAARKEANEKYGYHPLHGTEK